MNINTMPSDVKWFSSENLGMPQMTGGTADGMLRILDACLLEGVNSRVAASATVSGDLVNIKFSSIHGFQKAQVVSVSGATSSSINGEHKIISRDLDSITVKIIGVSDVSGLLTVKLAPLGWESIFGTSSADMRAYRSKTNKNKRVLFLDMSTPSPSPYHADPTSKAKLAVTSVCGNMEVLGAQINPMTDAVNTSHAESLFWIQKKSSYDELAVEDTKSQWKLIGNSNFFFFVVGWSAAASQDGSFYSDTYGFGEYEDITDGQIDTTFLMSAIKGMYPAKIGATYNSASNIWVAADGTKLTPCKISPIGVGVHQSGASGANFPNVFGDSIFTMPLKIYKGADIVGYLPSLLFVETKVGDIYNGDVVDDVLLLATALASKSDAPIAANNGTLGFYVGG